MTWRKFSFAVRTVPSSANSTTPWERWIASTTPRSSCRAGSSAGDAVAADCGTGRSRGAARTDGVPSARHGSGQAGRPRAARSLPAEHSGPTRIAVDGPVPGPAGPCRNKDPVLLTARTLAASLWTGPGASSRVAGGRGAFPQGGRGRGPRRGRPRGGDRGGPAAGGGGPPPAARGRGDPGRGVRGGRRGGGRG